MSEAEADKRKVGIGLIIGIIFLPLIFSWFTLRKGHSTLSRVLAMGWLVVMLISFAGGGGNKSNRQASTATAQPARAQQASNTAAAPAKPPPPPPPAEPKGPDGKSPQTAIPVGQAAVFAGLETTIVGAKMRSSVGNKYSRHKASEGAALLVVEYKVKNVTKEAIQAASFADAVIDKAGVSFEDTMDCNMRLDKVLGFTDTLNPGLPKKFEACFEVPKDTSGYVLKVNRAFEDGFLQLGI